MAFPSPPWRMHGQLWGAVLRAAPPAGRPGLHVVAFVSYEPGSTLAYSELLVAHRATGGPPTAATVSHLWVDSVLSRDGGRALWSLPKELAVLDHGRGGVGAAERHSWRALVDGDEVASAELVDVSGLAPRVPFRASTRQTETPDGPGGPGRPRVMRFHGSARALPCLGHWTFHPEGPLGWLAGSHPLASFRLRDFEVTFG